MDLMMFLLLALAVIVALSVSFLLYWPFYGAPYVPTQSKEIAEIFKKIKLSKGQIFCDLGCGDGRLVFEAAKITKAPAIGVDINWGLIQWCKFMTIIKNIKDIKFINKNIFKVELPKADVYYLYFWPGMVDEIVKKLLSYKVKSTIVSKSFEVKSLKSNDMFIVNGSQFWVYQI